MSVPGRIKDQVVEGPCSLKLCVPVPSSHFSSHHPSFSYTSLSAENIWAHEQRYLSVKFTFYHAHD